jgi:hypothetical protein
LPGFIGEYPQKTMSRLLTRNFPEGEGSPAFAFFHVRRLWHFPQCATPSAGIPAAPAVKAAGRKNWRTGSAGQARPAPGLVMPILHLGL